MMLCFRRPGGLEVETKEASFVTCGFKRPRGRNQVMTLSSQGYSADEKASRVSLDVSRQVHRQMPSDAGVHTPVRQRRYARGKATVGRPRSIEVRD